MDNLREKYQIFAMKVYRKVTKAKNCKITIPATKKKRDRAEVINLYNFCCMS